jgi:hypothetical protein
MVRRAALLLLLALIVTCFGQVPVARAAGFVVTNTNDSDAHQMSATTLWRIKACVLGSGMH